MVSSAQKCTSVPRLSVSPMTLIGETVKPSTTSISRFCGTPRTNSMKWTLPLRRMVSFSSFDSAFTHETPTPCRPPDTLYEFWSNLPPACSSVITISAAERFGSCLSSIFRPVGTPRPLSVIEIELSEWIVTWISVQCPASDSSIELSSTSNTRWCKPVPSEVSPMYMPGRLRTASRPSRIWIDAAPYSSCLAGMDAAFRLSDMGLLSLEFTKSGTDNDWQTRGLDPHRHHDVLEVGIVRNRDQCGRVGVAQRHIDLVAFQVVQHVQQVRHVEADVDIVATVVDFQFLDGFFLVRVGGRDLQRAGADDAAHALELIARHDGGALQGAQQLVAADGEVVLVALRDHARVVGELALDQLGDQFDVREAQLDLVGGDVQLDRLVVLFQQALQLDDGLARDDHFLALEGLLGLDLAEGQAVAVGGHGDDVLAVQHQQEAIQVVADVLLGHREVDHVEQVLQRLLRQGERGVEGFRFLHGGEFLGGQRLQREARLAALDGQALVQQGHRHVARFGQRAQDVEQLARGHGGAGNVGAGADIGVRRDLHFRIGGQERNGFAFLADEDIGQNRHGVPTLDNTAHDLQWPEKRVSGGFDQLHKYPRCKVFVESAAPRTGRGVTQQFIKFVPLSGCRKGSKWRRESASPIILSMSAPAHAARGCIPGSWCGRWRSCAPRAARWCDRVRRTAHRSPAGSFASVPWPGTWQSGAGGRYWPAGASNTCPRP